MIDAAAVTVDWLSNDATLVSLVGSNIWADEVPSDYTTPYVVVRVRSADWAVMPTPAYDRLEIQVDVVADDSPTADAISSRVRTLLQTMRGTFTGGAVIPAVDVVAATRVDDTTSSPARPRWVVAAEMTARAS